MAASAGPVSARWWRTSSEIARSNGGTGGSSAVRSNETAETPGRPRRAIFSPGDLEHAGRRLRQHQLADSSDAGRARAGRSRPRPRSSASSGVSGTAERITSATASARSRRSSVSQSAPARRTWPSGPQNAQANTTSRALSERRANATIWPVRSRIQGFSSRGSRPSSSSSSPIQRPASAPSCSSGTPATADDPRLVDALHDPLDVQRAALELAARVEEVDRVVPLGHRPDGLGEQVEPRGVEPAAERQVGDEAVGLVERGDVVDREREHDVARIAGHEVHEAAHRDSLRPGQAGSRASSSAKKIMSRSPGDRPAAVRSEAASARCWVPWFTTCASICQYGTFSSRWRSHSSVMRRQPGLERVPLGRPRPGERGRRRERLALRPRRLVAAREPEAPSLVGAQLVDEDRAEPAVADDARSRPRRPRAGRRSRRARGASPSGRSRTGSGRPRRPRQPR